MFSDSNNLLNKFGEFLDQNKELLDKIQAKEDIETSINLLYNNAIATHGRVYLQTFVIFGLFLASNYDELFGEPIPTVFADFLRELQLSKE